MKPVIVFLILIVLLAGCLGKEEIDDLAMVMAMGIDTNEDNNIILTVQIARPGDVTGNTGGGNGESIWTATSEGKTIFEAVRNLARMASRRVFWAHNAIIVVNETVARQQGVVDVIDFFNRNNELRMRTWIVVTEDKASEVVATKTGLEIIPGMSLERLFRYSQIVAEAPRSDVMTLTASYLGEHTHPYLALVNLGDRGINAETPTEFGSIPQAELSGTAVFKHDKMVGKLNVDESRGFLWFVEGIESAIIPLSCPDMDGKVSVELRNNTFDVIPVYKESLVSFNVNVESKPHLVELGCSTQLEHSEVLKKLEEQVEEAIVLDIERMLEKVQQEYKVDVLYLGRIFEGKYPKQWKQIEGQWIELFPNVEVNITANVELNNPLLLENPTRTVKD
ncbi:Ger(x)C family spore germination protein [Evansella sp. AB-rgal1]|uniref:Ger(x)C family spore germination protein n=1 Tax=Evansella sp. AB-rgal1 TaxID=3242696 RepID=UPI00359DD8FC